MLGLRLTTEAQPRLKNGSATHSTTGVANRKLEPDVQARSQPFRHWQAEVSAHFQDKSGEAEGRADPETPPEVHQLRIGAGIRGRHHGFEGHAAGGTVSRSIANDFRVHRARVAHALGRRLGFGTRTEVVVGRSLEALLTVPGAEIEPFSGVPGHIPRGGAMDRHPTDRVTRLDVILRRRGELSHAPLAAEMVPLPEMLQRRFAGRRRNLHPAHGISRDGVGGRISRRVRLVSVVHR